MLNNRMRGRPTREPRLGKNPPHGKKENDMGLPKNKQTDTLFDSILRLRSVEECYAYFEDLCTIQEVRDLGQRLEIARALDGGSSYQKTIAQTGVSTATIGRVNRCLRYGAGGYRLVLDRMQADAKEGRS